MSDYDRGQRAVAWVIVAVFLVGSVIVALGIIAGGLLLPVIGAAVVVVGVVGGAILVHAGLSVPVSFSTNFPEGAGTDDAGGPFGDAQHDEPYQTFREVPARKLPKGPDRERSKPQQMNLGPHENVRRVDGETVIEVPEKGRRED